MGEGIAIQQLGSRRIAYLANESGPIGMSVVDDKGLIYAVERFGGGLYILEYTGKTPLT